ncbi:MAG: ABC transporter substrate-binding protein, partial [Candidatus Woesearchaeota archaeon]
KAKKWLDEIGMEDVDGDGFRELPNGDKFNPTILFCKMGPVDPTTVFELVNSDFEEIGLDFRLNKVSRELHDTRRTANEFDVSAWPAGMMLDVAFGSSLGRYFAPIDTPFGSPWPGWVNWYETDGEEGMEPPEQIKELINWGEKIHSPVEKERMEAGKKLTESHAENLWTIGTIRMAPQPTIISNTLKNVPKKGFWGWDITNMRPMYPVQFYLEK